MTYERSDVVEAGDPFTETKLTRPFLVINTDAHPFDGEQYIAVTLTTRTWYEDAIPLTGADFAEGDVPAESSVVPWGLPPPITTTSATGSVGSNRRKSTRPSRCCSST
jgi:hypothetical protein